MATARQIDPHAIDSPRPCLDDPLPIPTGLDLDPAGHAECCRRLWATALAEYVRDARHGAAGRGGFAAHEALDDLTGNAAQLEHLCDMLDWDAEATRAAIISLMDSGHGTQLR